MSNESFILCVDDEPVNITIMEELLNERYQVECVGSGRACLDVIQQRRPDLVLLDVNMPDMDGLETCELIRKNPSTMDIPVVFVSALATEAELMAGYQAGGDDYITKPFSEDILQRKIEIVLEAESKKQQLLEMTDSAVQALAKSQGSMSELDMVGNFLHDCFKQTEFYGLSRVVFGYLDRLRLDCSLLFIVEAEPLYWFSDNIDRPMEQQILLNLNSQDRLVRFGSRMAINSSRATILIRKMPEETDKVTRLTEQLNIIIEGLSAKIHCMEVEDDLSSHRQALDSSIRNASSQLKDIKAVTKKQRNRSSKLSTKLLADIDQLVEKHGFNETQCKAIQQLVSRFENQHEKLSEERLQLQSRIENFIAEIVKTLTTK